jgi:hypothetical protein
MTPLDEIFLAESMSATAERFAAEDDGETPFLECFEQDVMRPIGDTYTWDEVVYSRGNAPVTGPNSPSRSTRPIGSIKRFGGFYAIKEHVDLDARFLLMARGDGSLMPNPAQELAKNIKNLVKRHRRTLNTWAARSFLSANGVVELDQIDNADVPAGTDLTYPIQSISAGQGSWALPATPIRKDTTDMRRVAQRVSGLSYAEAIASDVVEGYISENSKVVTLGNGIPTLADRMIAASAEDGAVLRMGGLDWRYHRAFHVTEANEAAGNVETTTDTITDTDLVAVLPERSRWGECFSKVEGVSLVPTGPLSQALATGGVLAGIATVRGLAIYATIEKNPMRIQLHAEQVVSLVHKVQKAAVRFNVTP